MGWNYLFNHQIIGIQDTECAIFDQDSLSLGSLNAIPLALNGLASQASEVFHFQQILRSLKLGGQVGHCSK